MATMFCRDCTVEWDSGNTSRDTRNCWLCGLTGDYGYWHDGEHNAPMVGAASFNAKRAAAEGAA